MFVDPFLPPEINMFLHLTKIIDFTDLNKVTSTVQNHITEIIESKVRKRVSGSFNVKVTWQKYN